MVQTQGQGLRLRPRLTRRQGPRLMGMDPNSEPGINPSVRHLILGSQLKFHLPGLKLKDRSSLLVECKGKWPLRGLLTIKPY